MTRTQNCIGSDFDDFLREEGILDEVEAGAVKKRIARMLERAIAESHLTKADMARRMGVSRTQLNRLLAPENGAVTLLTIGKAAKVLGKKMSITFEDATIGGHSKRHNIPPDPGDG
jgi:antitoxin HicB